MVFDRQTQLGLIRALVSDPDDGTSRAVYADWLEEQGDPLGGLEGGRLTGRSRHHHRAHPEVDELRRQRRARGCVEVAPVVEHGVR